MSEASLWDSVLSGVEKRVNHESFTTWFKPISFAGSDENTIRLRVPDRVFEDWIINNYSEVLEESLVEAGFSGYTIKFEVASKVEPQERRANKQAEAMAATSQAGDGPAAYAVAHASVDSEPADLPVNLKYSFENFVVGSCNQFAHAASLAVADAPSKTYNPL
ncbi:MAG: chromosomal replication initiator protein DnaA, partial [Blastocatellia bacterium]|nr:chromosomal replication initiator protein DnaA [Blastocatellia bacterium]